KHEASKALKGKTKIDGKAASAQVLNLFSDMCINTRAVRQGDEDLPWAYEQLSKNKADSTFWRVYGRSMELAWDKEMLPEGTKIAPNEEEAAGKIAKLFERDFFDRDKWRQNVRNYANFIGEFLEEPKGDGKSDGQGKGEGEQEKGQGGSGTGFDDISKNLPDKIDDRTAQELAKRLAEIGSNGLPRNSSGMEEFKEIMAGFGQGNPTQASISFYDMLSDSYNVMFATQPFGRPRVNPFQPVKWTPGNGVDKLDVGYSVQVGGRIIPAANTYQWKTRRRESHGGEEEVVPDLELFLDSSFSMDNPVNTISLPVLSSFVLAKKAHRRGAGIRSTNFSGENQYNTVELTRELRPHFENFVEFYRGGTVFPAQVLLEGTFPRHSVIITDTFLGNEGETVEAIQDFRSRHKDNKVTIYALHPVANGDALARAGADVVYGTTTDIFKRVVGKGEEVYSRRQ
ncbi:MAG: hypothetical protein KKD94_04440, partial [Nanoarchaeota archaeon]|nr:hypothetical protein [Nanoarchaeota archaeon]